MQVFINDPIDAVLGQAHAAAAKGDAKSVHAAFSTLDWLSVQATGDEDPARARLVAQLLTVKAGLLILAGAPSEAGQEVRAALSWLSTCDAKDGTLRNILAGLLVAAGDKLSSQGQIVAALANYGQAIALREGLRAELDPLRKWIPELRRDLAGSYLNRGNVLVSQGQLEAGVDDFGHAVALGETLRAELEPRSEWTTDMCRALASAYLNRGLTRQLQGQPISAVSDHAQAIALGEALCAELKAHSSQTVALRADLAAAYSSRGYALVSQGQIVAAISDYGRSIALREELRVELEPLDQWTPELRDDLSAVHMNRGNALVLQGHTSAGMDDYERAIELSEALRIELEPRGQWTPSLRETLASAYTNRDALRCSQSGSTANGTGSKGKKVVSLFSGSYVSQKEERLNTLNRARAWLAEDNPERAIAECESSARRLLALVRDGQNDIYDLLAEIQDVRAQAINYLINKRTAVEVDGSEECLISTTSLLDGDRETLESFMDLIKDWAGALFDQGVSAYSEGGLSEAVADLGRAISLYNELFGALNQADAYFQNWINDLAAAYTNRAVILNIQGRIEDAALDFGQAILLREGLRNKLEPQGNWSDSLCNDLAGSYMNRGNIFLARGCVSDAIVDYGRAIDLQERLHIKRKNKGTWPEGWGKDLAMVYSNRGNAFQAQGRSADAVKDFGRAISALNEIQVEFEEHENWSPETAETLAVLYTNRGVLRDSEGKFNLALDDLSWAIAIREKIKLRLTDRGEWKSVWENRLAESYLNRGACCEKCNRLDRALKDCSQAILLHENLREHLQQNRQYPPGWCNSLSAAYMNRGSILDSLGRLNEAVSDFNRAIALREDLRAELEASGDWPASWQNSLVKAYMNRAVAHRAQSKLDAAHDDLKKAIALGENLFAVLERQGELQPFWQDDLASAYLGRSSLLESCGHFDEALADCERAIDLSEVMRAKLHPQQHWTVPLQQHLAVAYMNRGCVLHRIGRFAEALVSFGVSRRLMNALLRLKLEPKKAWFAEMRNDLATVYMNRGSTWAIQGHIDTALADYQMALTINESLTDGALAVADRLRFSLYVNVAGLLDFTSDPVAWAIEKSKRMAQFLEQIPVTGSEQSNAPELYKNFALFHARWLAWCVRSGHLEVIPEILAIVQGREIAAEVLDQLQLDDPATPAAVRAFHRLRLELRKLNSRIEAVITGGKAGSQDGLAGIGRAGQVSSLSWDEAAYNALLAEHRQLTTRLVAQRAVAARESGYESLELPYQRLALDDLQGRLVAGEALLLLVHPEEGEAGVLLIRTQGDPHWQSLPQLPALALAVRLFDIGGRGLRGYRRGPSQANTAASARRQEQGSPDVETQRLTQALGPHGERIIAAFTERELFWDTLTDAMKQFFWSALASHLGDIEHLIAITHGDLHLLALDAGQPADLKLSRFPGVAFFAQRRGLYGDWRRPDAARSEAVGFLGFAGEKGDIPLAEQEATLLAQLHRDAGVRVYHPSRYPDPEADPEAEPVGLLHIACHGVEDPDDPKRTARQIAMAPNGTPAGPRLLNQNAIIASPAAPLDLYFSACLGGQTVEGLSGTPSGLVSACFRRNARWVAGALVPIPDLWSMVLAVLTHQAMLAQGLPLPLALAEGKRRLAAGDWYPDTSRILRSAAPQPFRYWAAVWAQDAWEKLSVEQYRQWSTGQPVYRPAELREWYCRLAVPWMLQIWALDQSEVDELHQRLHHHGPETLAEPLAAALAELWPSHPRIPPEPHLGTLTHGLVVFGEVED